MKKKSAASAAACMLHCRIERTHHAWFIRVPRRRTRARNRVHVISPKSPSFLIPIESLRMDSNRVVEKYHYFFLKMCWLENSIHNHDFWIRWRYFCIVSVIFTFFCWKIIFAQNIGTHVAFKLKYCVLENTRLLSKTANVQKIGLQILNLGFRANSQN